jgi:integrase
VSEVANLKVSDIDSQRMTLRVEQGKGQRDRYVMLSPRLLQLLREWWKAARPPVCVSACKIDPLRGVIGVQN